MEETVIDRIKSFCQKKGYSTTKLSELMGVGQKTANNYLNGSRKISFEFIDAFIRTFELDPRWVIEGKGDMLKKDNEELVKLSIEESVTKSIGVPYYENIEGTCGIVSQFNDYKEMPTFYINYQHFNDCNAYIPVVGDSMYPQYCSGEIIAVKRIFNMEIIQWGEAYFVVTNENANNLKTVKLVHPHEDPDKIILRASNPNFKGDTIIDKADIISMFIIKGKIKRNQL